MGDTIFHAESKVEPLPGFKVFLFEISNKQRAVPMIYAGLFPADKENFDSLSTAIDKLLLTDGSVDSVRERKFLSLF